MGWERELVRQAAAALGVQVDTLASTLSLVRALGLSPEGVEDDLCAVLNERIAMWLLGDSQDQVNFVERRALVAARLRKLVPSLDETSCAALVSAVTRAQVAYHEATHLTKEGVGTLAEPVLAELLAEQSGRCAVCGVPLTSRVARETDLFSHGFEPVMPMELDHTVPFYLGANDYTRLLCCGCNNIKHDLLGVQEDGLVVCGNAVRPRDRERVAARMLFWTLARFPRCSASGCEENCRSSTLFAERRVSDAPLVYGNMVVRCIAHAGPGSVWVHMNRVTEPAVDERDTD